MDVIKDGVPRDYFYRLAGTSNVEFVSRDLTVKLARDVFGVEGRRVMLARYDAMVDEVRSTFWTAEVPQMKYGVVRFVCGLFPIGQTDTRVKKLICIAVPEGS